MKPGIDMLLESKRDLLADRRIGLLAHAASVNAKGEHTVDRIAREGNCKIAALFGPEHGISTHAQDMEPVESHIDPTSNIPVYSLYGNTLDSLKPSEEMLSEIDLLVVDLQDIGSRYYTYVWTACLCAEACAEAGKKIIICDRPNPIGATIIEGTGVERGFESFVGLYSIPVRHGMTMGEIVHMVNNREKTGADLAIIKMDGWGREMNWPQTGLAWVNPSPNMRSYNAALLYPGMCLLEGTNVSEGRGTDTPFEIVGAPFIDADELVKEFNALGLSGVSAAPTAFIPVHQKWAGKLCHGIRWIISDAQSFKPYLTGLSFIWLLCRLYGDKVFEWRTAPYEFVTTRPAIDLLTGSSFFRENIAGMKMEDLKALTTTSPSLIEEREKNLLY